MYVFFVNLVLTKKSDSFDSPQGIQMNCIGKIHSKQRDFRIWLLQPFNIMEIYDFVIFSFHWLDTFDSLQGILTSCIGKDIFKAEIFDKIVAAIHLTQWNFMIYRAFLLSTQVALISLKNWTSLTVPGVSKKNCIRKNVFKVCTKFLLQSI